MHTPSPLAYSPSMASALPERPANWSKWVTNEEWVGNLQCVTCNCCDMTEANGCVFGIWARTTRSLGQAGILTRAPILRWAYRLSCASLSEFTARTVFLCLSQREQQSRSQNHRVMGRRFTPKGKQNESKSSTIHTFGADTDRFKHSILGRLDLAAASPGPGWYCPLDVVPLESQAQLTRKAGADASKLTPQQRQQQMSVFRMTGVQTADIKKPIEQRTPGPAYYCPKKPEKKTFSQNNTGKWV